MENATSKTEYGMLKMNVWNSNVVVKIL